MKMFIMIAATPDQESKIEKEYPINYKVKVSRLGKATETYYCKNVQPSPMVKGIKFVGAIKLDLMNVSNVYAWHSELWFSGCQMQIEKVTSDIVVRRIV